MFPIRDKSVTSTIGSKGTQSNEMGLQKIYFKIQINCSCLYWEGYNVFDPLPYLSQYFDCFKIIVVRLVKVSTGENSNLIETVC